jgi:hypothetical protein
MGNFGLEPGCFFEWYDPSVGMGVAIAAVDVESKEVEGEGMMATSSA